MATLSSMTARRNTREERPSVKRDDRVARAGPSSCSASGTRQAITHFRAALQIVPGMRDALFSLGWTYSLVDNRDEAQRFLKKFVDVAGQDAPANYVKAAQDRLGELSVN